MKYLNERHKRILGCIIVTGLLYIHVMSHMYFETLKYDDIKIGSHTNKAGIYSLYEIYRDENNVCWFHNFQLDKYEETSIIPNIVYNAFAFRVALMNLDSINGYHNTRPNGDLYVILEISESNGELVTVRGYDDQGNGEYFPFGKNVSLLYNTISHLERGNMGEYMVKHTFYELRATVGRFLYKLKNTNQNGCCF